MTRRDVLTAAELTAVTVALAASLPMLAHAANWGAAWGGPALLGTLTALMLLVPTVWLLLIHLTAEALRTWRLRREYASLPPSARHPLGVPARRDDSTFDAYATEYMREGHRAAAYAMGETGATGRHSAPSWAVGEPLDGTWSAPVAEGARRAAA
jgi:hypothetical protein